MVLQLLWGTLVANAAVQLCQPPHLEPHRWRPKSSTPHEAEVDQIVMSAPLLSQ